MSSFIVKTLAIVISFVWPNSIYDIDITTIQGTTQSMKDFQGKKLMVVILPTTQAPADSVFLYKLDSISRKEITRIAVIGVLSYEDGFNQDESAGLRQWYQRLLGNQIVITSGMNTRKLSASAQHPLLKWLTGKESNGHFDNEARGVGQIYLVNEIGELYAVLGPEVTLSSQALQKLLQ